jgi:hypothetical protein
MVTCRPLLALLTLACAVAVSGCGVGQKLPSDARRGATNDLANTRCLVGEWTLVSVVDRPPMEPPWHMQGVVTITFNADGTGRDDERGVDVSYLQNGQVVPQTADASNEFTWVVRGNRLSYPTDSPSMTVRGSTPPAFVLMVSKRQPEVFRCDGNTLTESHALRGNGSVTRERSTTYRHS